MDIHVSQEKKQKYVDIKNVHKLTDYSTAMWRIP